MSTDKRPMEFGPESLRIGIDPTHDLMRGALSEPLAFDQNFIDTQTALHEVVTFEQRKAVGGIIGELSPVLSQRMKVKGLDEAVRYTLQGFLPTEAADGFERGSLLPVAKHMENFATAFKDKNPKTTAKVLEALVSRAVMTVNASAESFDTQDIVRELFAAQATLGILQSDPELLAELVEVDTGDKFSRVGVNVKKRSGNSRSLVILPVPVLDHGEGVLAYMDPKVEEKPNSRFMRDGNNVLLGVGFDEATILNGKNLDGLADEIKPLLRQRRKRLWLTSGLTIREITEDEEAEPLHAEPEVTRTLGVVATAGQVTNDQIAGHPVIVPAQSVGPFWAKGRMGDIDAIIPQAEVSATEGETLRTMIAIQGEANRLRVPVDLSRVANAAKMMVLEEQARKKGRNTTL